MDRYVYLDYVFWTSTGINSALAPEEWKEAQDVRKPGVPDELEALLRQVNELTPERQKRIDLYRYHDEHGRHQAPEAWASKHRR